MKTKSWFEVDREGLAKILARRGKAFVLYELIQNAWDSAATKVIVTLKALPGVAQADLSIVDNDPDGFKDLSHAFTLFARSSRGGDPEKRGRFNLGEKLVLSLCAVARITTTTGEVYFDEKGRHKGRFRRKEGSEFKACLRLTRDEIEEVGQGMKLLLPPPSVYTEFNGEPIIDRTWTERFEMDLPTEVADEEGVLRRTIRKTTVEVHEVRPGEKAHIYEMGIPIVETGDKYHYNILQKVPLNADRDNVTPAYLQEVRTAVLNHLHDRITKEEATAPWVRDAAAEEVERKGGNPWEIR